MTEAEWLACENTGHLLNELYRNVSDRKWKLFQCALSRRLVTFPEEMDIDQLLRVAEEQADGLASPEVVADAIARIERTAAGLLPWAVPGRWVEMHGACLKLVHMLRGDDPYDAHMSAVTHFVAVTCHADQHGGRERVEADAITCLRCLVGNPFRPCSFHPAWRTDTVLALAGDMYNTRTFGPAPILADALQDAGCDCDDLLTHLRDLHAAHVRGCWALDRVLGKGERSHVAHVRTPIPRSRMDTRFASTPVRGYDFVASAVFVMSRVLLANLH